jgi:glycosyltransferase involved in cell wall biosynthesis
MEQNPKIIAIFIAYNEAAKLEGFYRTFPKELFDEIMLFDDGSKDNTFELAQSLGIESYKNQVNLGYGGNLKRALTRALEKGADIIVDLHPDGEYKPSAIVPAIEEIKKGAELIMGNRFYSKTSLSNKGMYWWKVLPLKVLNWICKKILGLPITDYHQGFRVYTRQALQKTNYIDYSNGYIFSLELLAQAAFYKIKVSQVPVEVLYTGDKRGSNLKHTIVYSLKIFKVLLFFLMAKFGFSSVLFQKSRTYSKNNF